MKMKLWSFFDLSNLTASALVTISLLGCGTVDPADNNGRAGSGGDTSSAGEGSGSGAMGGAGTGATGGAPEGGSGGSGAPPAEGTLLPWVVGNTWTYEVTEGGVVSEKVTTIEAEELVGGTGPFADVMAFHVVTTKGTNGNDETRSWQGPDDGDFNRIVRYREQSFSASTGDMQMEEHWEPPKLHIDGTPERSVAGATWLEEYEETKLEVDLPPNTHLARDRWTVLADDVTLTVPAGTFENVIHVRKVGSSSKEYWYARGVGKLKETGTQTEELIEYQVEEPAP
jgi:hypothetical protein